VRWSHGYGGSNLGDLQLAGFREQIYFGSLMFTPHSPAWRPAFNSLHEVMDLTLGDLRFHINTVSILRLSDPIRSTPGESTSPSTIMAPSSSSSVGSSSEPESTPTSIFCVDYDAYHVTGLNDSAKDHDGGYADHESCNISVYPTHI
jgi:hypothetical protein